MATSLDPRKISKPELYKQLTEAQDRIFDILLADDGQAYKEARKYLQRTRPDLVERIDYANEQSPLKSD